MDATPADPPRLNEDETTPEEQAMDAAMGTVLKLLRIEKKLTLDQLAAEVGMNRKTIMRIESGERSIRMAQLYRLCIALGVMPSDVTEAAEKKVGIE
jgi:transcriptional regulator with XRE-family HTH domain